MIVLSILIQMVAAVLTLRFMRVSERWRGWNLAWMFAFFAIFLNVVFGANCFFDCVSHSGFPSSLPSAPYVTPEISFFMILGITGGFPVSNYFQRLEESIVKNDGVLEALCKASPIGIFRTDRRGQYFYVNQWWRKITGLSLEQAKGDGWAKSLHPEDRDRVAKDWKEAAEKGLSFQAEYRFQHSNGKITWALGQAEAEIDSLGKIYGYVGTITDITKRKMAESLISGRNIILELIATGCPLQETLDALTLSVEEQTNDLYCSLLLLDSTGKRLFNGSSPHLPKDYVKAIDGVFIGPSVGSCGTAAYNKEVIIVEDIASDPLWTDYKESPLSHGLRACWSAPILGSKGQCLGTFALYYIETRTPTEWELDLIKNSAHIAGLAIERNRDETALKEANDQLERRVQERTAKLKEEEAYQIGRAHV